MSVADFRSDTVTRPSPAMLAAMAEAEVGDDVLGHDPTTLALEQEAARVLGEARAPGRERRFSFNAFAGRERTVDPANHRPGPLTP